MNRLVYWSLIGLVAMPLFVILYSYTQFDVSIWQHLYQTVLPDYVGNSLLLAVSVGTGSTFIGTLLAWYIVRYDFPGRKILGWLVILPLAMPAYIIAYTYTGLLDFSGPVQTLLRQLFKWQYGDYWFPAIRSIEGASVMMTLVLYPYVYLLARNAFASIPPNLKEAADTLGVSEFKFIVKVVLPIARPAIVAGTFLVIMETLADYGTVAYFGVSTFTTGIFKTWYGIGSQQTALQLSGMLIVFVFCCVFLEQRNRRLVAADSTVTNKTLIVLHPLKGSIVILLCFLPVLAGFIVPAMQLVQWIGVTSQHGLPDNYWSLVQQTVLLALSGAIFTLLLALFLTYAKRWHGQKLPDWTLALAGLGYAIPGVVIAVGLLVPLGIADRSLNQLTKALFDVQPGLILSGTVFVLLFACSIRFLAIAIQHSQNGLSSITPAMDQAAYSLGRSKRSTFLHIHLPLMRNSMLAAMLLVFVDIMKELPATLVLRPFNFNTLAVKAYEYAMDERLQHAALPALTIVLCGIFPVILLIQQIRKNEDEHAVN